MKKKISFLLLVCCLHSLSWSQVSIKTNVPCTDEAAMQAKGRWMKSSNFDRGSTNNAEVNKRIDAIHNLILRTYSQPAGVDAAWYRATGVSYFGAKRQYHSTNNGLPSFDQANLPHFFQYNYNVGLFRYQCEYGKKTSLLPGYPGETGTWLNIIANRTLGDIAPDDSWTIDGLPVMMHKPPITTKAGIEFSYPEPGLNVRHVLVHRNGILPYIPVSRKQYLEYCIIYYSKFYNEIINNYEQMPVRSLAEQEKEKEAKLSKFQKDFANDPKKLKSNVDYYLSGFQTDQQRRDEQVTKTKRARDNELRKFSDELENTMQQGLLDSPAMVLTKYQSNPVFESDPEKGSLLVTENPGYLRRDLPKHVPQLFVISLVWDEWGPQKNFAEVFQHDFPFEKLQAMIDK